MEKMSESTRILEDDPCNQDEIGEKEILVVSFGTSFNDSRARDIRAIEDAFKKTFPEWSVRRAFTSKMIIDHIKRRDNVQIDTIAEALERADKNHVRQLVIQPTHLMQGAEYDKMMSQVVKMRSRFENVKVAQPLLGEVGKDGGIVNEDKEAVAEILIAEALKSSGYRDLIEAENDGTAFVFLGHGTYHAAKISYNQMQRQMTDSGYKNIFIGTVEGDPKETDCENILKAVKDSGYTKVIFRPMMVVAGDHANNDMAGEEEDSWCSRFLSSGAFQKVEPQIEGLGRIPAIQNIYIEHTQKVMSEI